MQDGGLGGPLVLSRRAFLKFLRGTRQYPRDGMVAVPAERRPPSGSWVTLDAASALALPLPNQADGICGRNIVCLLSSCLQANWQVPRRLGSQTEISVCQFPCNKTLPPFISSLHHPLTNEFGMQAPVWVGLRETSRWQVPVCPLWEVERGIPVPAVPVSFAAHFPVLRHRWKKLPCKSCLGSGCGSGGFRRRPCHGCWKESADSWALAPHLHEPPLGCVCVCLCAGTLQHSCFRGCT